MASCASGRRALLPALAVDFLMSAMSMSSMAPREQRNYTTGKKESIIAAVTELKLAATTTAVVRKTLGNHGNDEAGTI